MTEITNIIKEARLEDVVDFISGGLLELFFTEQEHQTTRADYLAAQNAGVDLQSAQWLQKGDAQAACDTLETKPFADNVHRNMAQPIQAYLFLGTTCGQASSCAPYTKWRKK